MVEPLRATDTLQYREVRVANLGAVEAIANAFGNADALLIRREIGDPLLVPSTNLWRRISALLKEGEPAPK
jgi:hypothetical protein